MSYKIEKQANGKYLIRVWSKPDEFGKKQSKQVSNIATVSVAKKIALEIEEQFAMDIEPTHDCTFQQMAEMYFKAKEKTLSPNTLIKKQSYRKAVIEKWGKVRCNKINTRNVQDWINELEGKTNCHKKGKTLKKGTIQEYVKFLNTVINWAVAQDYLDFNRIKKLEYKEDEEEFEPTILPPEKLTEILLTLKHDFYNLYIPTLLALLLDPRRGEATALTWGDIDFERGIINLTRTAYEDNGTKFKNKMKSRTSRRVLVMSDFLKQELLEHKQMNAYLPSDLACATVFLGEVTPSYISHKFHDFMQARFGIQMRFHDLRHNFNQLCYESNIDLSTRSKMLGHANEKITNEIYTHFSHNKAKEAVECVANMLNLQPQS